MTKKMKFLRRILNQYLPANWLQLLLLQQQQQKRWVGGGLLLHACEQ
jgi:hypothetical protein